MLFLVSVGSIEEMSAEIPLMSVTRISGGKSGISRNLPLGDPVLVFGLCKFLDSAFMKSFFTPHNFVTLVFQTHADPWILCFALSLDGSHNIHDVETQRFYFGC